MGRPGAGTGGNSSGGRSGGGFRPTPKGSGSGRPQGGGRPAGSGGLTGRSIPNGGGRGAPPRGVSGGRGAPPPPRGIPGGRGAPPPPRGRRPAPPPPRGRYGGYNPPPRYGAPRRYGSGRRNGCVGSIAAGIVVIIVLIIVGINSCAKGAAGCFGCGGNESGVSTDGSLPPEQNSDFSSSKNSGTSSGSPQNSQNSLQSSTPSKNIPTVDFSSACIIDEVDWFDDVKTAGEKLKFVYDRLGIQPYVVFRQYDKNLVSDSQKIDYCEKWYEDHIKNEDTFLVMYFAEDEEKVGYIAYCAGSKAAKVYDDLGEVFQEGIEEYWYTRLSTDDVIKSAFEYACNKIGIG